MLLLFMVILICHAPFASTKESHGGCNANSKPLTDHNPCDPTKVHGLAVSHASHCGDTVLQAQTIEQPTIRWENAKPNNKYLVVMVDPDAPTQTPGRVWVHLIVNNVAGSALANNQKITGDIVGNFGYHPPTPPKGIHRYFVFVYESPRSDVISSQTSRGGFSLDRFIKENHICKLVAQSLYKVAAPV